MSSDSMKVLVMGATGKQGGHVARLLLGRGHRVRALTRKPDSKSARALADLGAEIVAADMLDRSSIERAAEGVDEIFGMTTPYDAGVQVEIDQGLTLADAVKAAGKYMVFSSVASADESTGIPHFESKWKAEQRMKELGLEVAVIAPVYFMENAITGRAEQMKEGIYPSPLPPDLRLQQVAVDDVAAFAVLALENKDRFVGTRTDIASDELTEVEAAEYISRASGRQIDYMKIPMEEIRSVSEDAALMYEWFIRVGYSADIAGLRRDYPEVGWHTYKSWAEEQDWDSILSE